MFPSTSSSIAMQSTTVVDTAGESFAAVAELRRPDRLVLSGILGEGYERRAAESLTSLEVERLLNARLERPVLFLRDRKPYLRPKGWASDHTPEVFFSACGNDELAEKMAFYCCRHCKKTFDNNADYRRWKSDDAIRQYFDYVGTVDAICRACARHVPPIIPSTTWGMVTHLQFYHRELYQAYNALTATGRYAATQHIEANLCPSLPADRDGNGRGTKRKRLASKAPTTREEQVAAHRARKDDLAKWMVEGPQRRKLPECTINVPVDFDAHSQQVVQAAPLNGAAAPALPPLGTKAGIAVPQLPIVDVTLEVGGEEAVQTSSAYLAAYSPYFARLFGADFREKAEKRAKFEDIDPVDFAHFLCAIYPDGAALSAENVVGVLQLADRFSIPSLFGRCIAFLQDNIDANNVFHIIDIAERFGEAALFRRSAEFLERDRQLMPAKKLLVFDRFDALHELRDRFIPTLCKLKLNEIIRSVEFLSMSQDCRDAVTFYYD